MAAQYVVRFDDICPEMNWQMWEHIEQILVAHQISPILAVVPDNQDPVLKAAPANASFWDRVRQWQAAGWCIGLHGYQHGYETQESGIIGLNQRSEFAGLPYETQLAKIDAGMAILRREHVQTDTWVAPGHSFDRQTIKALQARGIHTISDGYFARAVHHMGSVWIPQQLWRFQPMLTGTWTVCYHHNHWSAAQLAQFERDIIRYKNRIVSVRQVLSQAPPRIGLIDTLMAAAWRSKIRMAEHLKAAILRR